ncbi:MAG TPA: ABC transporter ATP-binding protein [Patescibacteria group bacterium]|nr:ABC transporter ATP-binding protein [Patescibacteria group bacterium]
MIPRSKMSEVSPNSQAERRYSTGVLVRRLLGLAWNFRADCIASVLLSLALLLLGLAGLQLLGIVIDVIRHALDPAQRAPTYPFGWQPPAAWGPLQIVTTLSGGIVLQALLRAWLTYEYNMVTARLTQGKIVPGLRDRLYARLQLLSFRFFDVHGSSSIFNRVTGDVQNTRLFVDGVVLQGLNMLLTLLAYFIFMWRIQRALTLACLSVTVGLWWVTHFYSGRLRPAYLKNRELFDKLVELFTESVRGMQTVKGFAAEPHQIRAFETANAQVSNQQQRIFLDLSLFTPATQILSQLSLVILFAYGGWLYVQGRIPLGTGLVVFAGLLQQFNGQVANITTIANSVQQSFAAARRVFEVLDTPTEVQSRPGAFIPPRIRGHVQFDRVSFGYHEQTPVLRDITFSAQPGQVIGVFGMTGTGKSSLLSLIPRFYDPQQGSVLVDGRDVRDLDLDGYRRHVGIVYQESFLFSNTVAANIAFGNPHASQEQIEKAARLASAHTFILELPEAYNTVLGESGVDLSGGQRQRLALARALLLEPPILILDDPTASVDSKTEHEIVTALRQAMTGRTTFIVANRFSLLRRADHILVLDHGRLVNSGNHEELIQTPGPYREAARLQLLDQEHSAPESSTQLSAESGRTAGAPQFQPAK